MTNSSNIENDARKCDCPACDHVEKGMRRGWCGWCWKHCVVEMLYQGERRYATPTADICARVHAGQMRRKGPAAHTATDHNLPRDPPQESVVSIVDIIRAYGREAVVAQWGEARVQDLERKAAIAHGVVTTAVPLVRAGIPLFRRLMSIFE